MVKVLLFDRKVKNLIFLCKKLEKFGLKTTAAENGSKFLAALAVKKFNAIIISKKELKHYNCTEKSLLKRLKRNLVVCSYIPDKVNCIKKIKMVSPKLYEPNVKIQMTKSSLKKFFLTLKRNKNFILTSEFIYKLPKKSAILLRQLVLNKKDGITDEEISYLFWGNKLPDKKHCIYNHIYNLKKSLKTEFKDTYTIYKDNDRYRLVNLKEIT
ncbi:helix-turn-helix domain-containing protein [Treponema pedis]|uniref:Helix-turn-helix domain-containing protein n=1 Tax=Treponema pedis TaxID=409322 RepID=A0A7S6WPU6_9SPIR|nr:helix-turn-helix domain-containing protein [Treponema pedis]QOW61118.1 helix-turn-helix domain-containing protein [Treponema pedis]